jgi:hypothetical protein
LLCDEAISRFVSSDGVCVRSKFFFVQCASISDRVKLMFVGVFCQDSTNSLSHQQLTVEDVPVIVDRLIDFVTAHGIAQIRCFVRL